MARLEKLFYMKNRRYSPHNNNNKHLYMNITRSTVPEQLSDETPIKISKKFIHEINKEIQKNLLNRQSDDEDYDEDDEDDDDNCNLDMEESSPSKKSSKRKNDLNGYIDKNGVYRYRDPTIFFIPQQPQGGRGKGGGGGGKGGGGGEDDSGAQFQIIKNSPYSFADIGGYDAVKNELLQTADILLNYDKYQKYNVRTPKGMIFEGPPGNGKTLLAKGFSGEINVTFIPVSGSEFSEKYVGVGASRVRELFKLAEDNKPCIIFIDEIDALARKRGNDMVSSNSEKDQTLNQLLINLDGYKDSHGIFVVGATNRLDLLDPALTRAGRMDKNIFIGNPDSNTRRAILEIHLKGKPIHADIQMEYMVEMTGGFSGAQVENLLNESMLRALRENRTMILLEDLEFIANRILAGWQSTESKYSDDIIDRIAVHEMGHAIVGFLCKDHSKLSKVCLNMWSPTSPGYTVFDNSNDENQNIYTKNGLFSHLMVLLSGRIAEDVFYGYSVTTGARKDFEEAYHLAKNMILQYGMGTKTIYPDSSDQSKFLIDQEVSDLILRAQEEALNIITNTKDIMIDGKIILKRDSILKAEQIIELIHQKYPDSWIRYPDILVKYV
jgi:cell division protease FtsH